MSSCQPNQMFQGQSHLNTSNPVQVCLSISKYYIHLKRAFVCLTASSIAITMPEKVLLAVLLMCKKGCSYSSGTWLKILDCHPFLDSTTRSSRDVGKLGCLSCQTEKFPVFLGGRKASRLSNFLYLSSCFRYFVTVLESRPRVKD